MSTTIRCPKCRKVAATVDDAGVVHPWDEQPLRTEGAVWELMGESPTHLQNNAWWRPDLGGPRDRLICPRGHTFSFRAQ